MPCLLLADLCSSLAIEIIATFTAANEIMNYSFIPFPFVSFHFATHLLFLFAIILFIFLLCWATSQDLRVRLIAYDNKFLQLLKLCFKYIHVDVYMHLHFLRFIILFFDFFSFCFACFLGSMAPPFQLNFIYAP